MEEDAKERKDTRGVSVDFDKETWDKLNELKENYGIAKTPFIRIAVKKTIDDFNEDKQN